jgi:CRP-like cAMP-binding protein
VASLEDTLRQVPLFSALSQRQLRRLRKDLRERTFRPGTAILLEGKMSGVDFFVLVEGEASVTVGGKEIGRLRPGDHFGELGLISERERTATVTAVEPVRCLAMATWNFRKFVNGNPDVAWKLLQYVGGLVHADPRALGGRRGL